MINGLRLANILRSLRLRSLSCLKAVLKLTIDLTFIKKYVDDLITVVPENKIDEIVDVFNSFHGRQQFTVEKEQGNMLPFLDMYVIRNGNEFLTKWYVKPTASGRILNYSSKSHV